MSQSEILARAEAGRAHFLRDPDAYDREIRYFVPYQPEILESLLESMLLMESEHAPVLDLGCRTGLLTARVAEEKPYARLAAVDQDQAMVLAAKERLGRAAEWVDVERMAIARHSRPAAYDYILSNLALSFLESAEDKDAVCRNAFWSLKPGGIFAFSVLLDVGSPEAGSPLWKQWERDVLSMGARRQDIVDWHANHRPAYAPATPERWLAWLDEAGFIHSELVWSETIFGTFWAKKPAADDATPLSGRS